jgi:hypothetical protein
MADPTAFANLASFCEHNGCKPCFRAETLEPGGAVSFSLSAVRVADGKRLYDLRDSRDWTDAEAAATDLATQAQAQWWPSV